MAAQASSIVDRSDFGDATTLAQLSRPARAKIAADTLATLNAGGYQSPDGSHINLQDDVTFCNDNSALYTEDQLDNLPRPSLTEDEMHSSPTIDIRCCTTLQAARSLVAEVGEDRVGVLNFASAKNPGGGFLGGAQAQEESLARSSSLYIALTQPRFTAGFYHYHRHGERGVYSHRMIYSPRVTVFKDDDGHLLSSPYHVSMVTSPAPNAGVLQQPALAREVMHERVRRLLHVFREHKHDCLVLGAFGCGVFQNNPFDVAVIFREHLQSKEFRSSFKHVIFAVLNSEMYKVFLEVFSDAIDGQNLQNQFGNMTFTSARRRKGGNSKPKRTRRGRETVTQTIHDIQ